MQLKYLLLLAFASALISYLLVFQRPGSLPEPLFYVSFYSPGWLFGALVLAPMESEGSRFWWRRILLVIASVLIWRIAVDVAITPPLIQRNGIVSFASAGLLGALMIYVACRFIIPRKFSLLQILMASLAGVVSSAVMGAFANHSSTSQLEDAAFLSGFIIWQMGVAFALFSNWFSVQTSLH